MVAAGELELRAGVLAADGVTAVVADAQPFAAEREVARSRSGSPASRDDLVVDVQLQRTDRPRGTRPCAPW